MRWSRGVHTWSWRVIGLLVAYFAVSVARVDLGSGALLVAGTAMLVVAVHVAVSSGRTWDVGVLVVATFVAQHHAAAATTTPRPAFFALVCVLVVAGCQRPVLKLLPVATCAVTAYVATTPGPLGAALLEVLNAVAAGVGAGVVTHGLARTAARSDQAMVEQEAAYGSQVVQAATASAAAEARRLLHDELVAVLAMVRSRSGPTRAAARHALARLDAFDSSEVDTSDPGDLEATLQGVNVTFEDCRRVSADTIPREVWVAISGATREALRNVAEHSGVDAATVVLRGDSDHVLLEVIDRGSGFDPAERAGIGLTESVVQRMVDAGGGATIDSAPGRGTAVRLTWARDGAPLPRPPARWHLLHEAVGDLRLVVGVYPLLQLVLGMALVIALPGPFPVASYALAAAVVSASLVVVGRAVRAPLRRADLVLATVAPTLAIGVGLLLAGQGALRGFESWIVGLAEVPIIVLALVATWQVAAVAAVAASATVLAAALLDPSLSPLDVPGPVLQPVMYAVLFGTMGFGVLRVGAAAQRAHEETLEVLLQHAGGEQRRAALARRMDGLDDRVRTLLEAVAGDALDARLAVEAGLLAHAVRDELVAPGALDSQCRAVLEGVRRDGGVVALRPGLGEAHRPHLAAALEKALGPALAKRDGVGSVVVEPRAGSVVVTVWPSDDSMSSDAGY